MKRLLKLFAFVVMLISLSFVVFAAPVLVDVIDSTEEIVSSEPMEVLSDNVLQDGTEAYPYLISSAVEFNKYANYVNKNNATYGSLCYKLVSNVDFRFEQLVPFGTESAPFKGTLDGNGYALLNVTVPDKPFGGVVGYMTMGTIKNLGVEYSDSVTRKNFTNTTQKYYFGGILGRAVVASGKKINISGCRTSGNLLLHYDNTIYAGGIVGAVDSKSGNAVISDCLTGMSFDITSVKNSYLAGFAAYVQSGSNNKDCVIKNGISLGDVSLVTTGNEATVASFVSYVQKDEAGYSGWASEEEATLAAESVKQLENCVALGNVNAKAKSVVKAAVLYANKAGEGKLVVSNCYSSKEQTVTAEAASTTTPANNGTKLDGAQFESPEFYKNTLGIDLDNKWYFTDAGRLGLRTTAKSKGAAVIDLKRDVRLTSKPGVRFRSEIEAEKRNYAVEYGIIVASKENLGDNELTLDFEGNKAVGIAYGEDVDKFISKDDESIVFSAVVINIKKENYGSEIVARTYIKYVCEGETVVAYGDPMTTSLTESALAVRLDPNYEYLTDEQKALLETML